MSFFVLDPKMKSKQNLKVISLTQRLNIKLFKALIKMTFKNLNTK